MRRSTLIAMAALLLSSPVLAQTEVFPPGLAGTWTGSGEVRDNDTAPVRKVRCTMESEQRDNFVGFKGTCRAMLIFTREISAELFDNDGRVTGTYIGAQKAGKAELEGELSDTNTLTLNMTFEREVNGDNKATMTLTMPDIDTLIITTLDMMPSGTEIPTTQVTFKRD